MIHNVAASPTTTVPARPSLGTLVGCCAAVFTAQVGLVLPAAINGVLQRELPASGGELAWITDAFLVPIAMLSLTFGVLGDRYGRRLVLICGAVAMAAGYAVSAVGASIVALWIGQALAGIGAAGLFTSSLATITATTPGAAERARGLAAWATALSTGALVAPIMSGLVVQSTSFRWAFAVAGLLALISAVLTVVFLRGGRTGEAAH